MSHDTKGWCKIWRKPDLWFGKWHEEFGKFSSEPLKQSKFVFSWDPFVQSRKCMGYKLTEELQVMTLKNHEKSEEELTKEFDEFWLENSNVSKIYTLVGCFWPRYIMF